MYFNKMKQNKIQFNIVVHLFFYVRWPWVFSVSNSKLYKHMHIHYNQNENVLQEILSRLFISYLNFVSTIRRKQKIRRGWPKIRKFEHPLNILQNLFYTFGPPAIPKVIMKLIRKKKKLWKRLKASESQELFLKIKFKDLGRKTKKLIDLSYYQLLLKSLSGKLQENPKHFWSFYSRSKAKRIPETVIYENVHSSDLQSKVELFNNFFQ